MSDNERAIVVLLLAVSTAFPPAHLYLQRRALAGGSSVRHGRAGAFWLWLAMASALLMAIAPVVSWTMQAMHADTATARAHHPQGHHPAPGTAEPHHQHAAAAVQSAPPMASDNPHAGHGAACDYCLIAARALPLLFSLLLALLPILASALPCLTRGVIPACPRWPAHAVRGPPLLP